MKRRHASLRMHLRFTLADVLLGWANQLMLAPGCLNTNHQILVARYRLMEEWAFAAGDLPMILLAQRKLADLSGAESPAEKISHRSAAE